MPEDTTTPQPEHESVAYVNPNGGDGGNLWQAITSSKLLKIGLPLLLVALLPIVVILAQQRQGDRSKASAATVLSFAPNSSQSAPIKIVDGDDVELQVMLDPGANLVSSIKLVIEYDADRLELINHSDFQANKTVFPNPIQTIYSNGRIDAVLTIGVDATRAIQSERAIATVKFKAIMPTVGDATTNVRFGTQTLVTSLASTDQAAENVLSNASPALISIAKNVNIGSIKGTYFDKDNKPLTIAGTRAVLYAEGSQDGAVITTSPEFLFNNIKAGKYRLQLMPKSGYILMTAVCKDDCKVTPPAYTQAGTVTFEVVPGGTSNISVKYIPTGSTTPVASTSASVQSTISCTTTTADLNKDGRVDNADSTKFANCYKKSPTTLGCEVADIDKNGTIDAIDANCILRGGQ